MAFGNSNHACKVEFSRGKGNVYILLNFERRMKYCYDTVECYDLSYIGGNYLKGKDSYLQPIRYVQSILHKLGASFIKHSTPKSLRQTDQPPFRSWRENRVSRGKRKWSLHQCPKIPWHATCETKPRIPLFLDAIWSSSPEMPRFLRKKDRSCSLACMNLYDQWMAEPAEKKWTVSPLNLHKLELPWNKEFMEAYKEWWENVEPSTWLSAQVH